MLEAICYVVSGSAFVALCYLVPRWLREQWWLIKEYPKLLWGSLTKRQGGW